MSQSKSSADDPAVFKKGINLMGVSIGGDIEIFRGLPEEKIPNASPDEISQESMPVEAVENFQSFLIDHSSRNGMLRSWNDELVHFFSSGQIRGNGVIITELVQEARDLARKFCLSVTLI
jgi:hypothetical protein